MLEKMQTESGKEPRMKVAKQALRKVIDQLSAETKLGVLLLNGSKREDGWLVPLGPLDRFVAADRVEKVKADGGTPLGGAMKTAMDQLLAMRAKQPVGDYRMLVVTDGEATDKNVLSRYLPDIVARGIVVDVIGVDMKSDHTLASKSHSYRRANDAASFEKALTEIFAESSMASTDTGGSDFDLISGLPDQFATDALAALASIRNEPIDQTQSKSASTNTDSSGATAPAQNTQSPVQQAPQGGNTWFVVAIVVFILIFLNGILNSKKRR
jgi:uncharacterized protein YegL